jgi:acyl-CoA synthetase (AMP-forming)/AMP-acid ligase II
VEKGRLNTGDHVALIYPPGVDLISAFYGCLFVGVVPVTIRPPHPQNLQTTLPTVRMIVDVSKSVVILSSAQVDIAENLQTTSRTCRPHSPPCA